MSNRSEVLLALVGFMLDKMMGYHFYLVYDQMIDDLSDPIIRQMQNYGDVAVFPYDTDFTALQQMIRGFYHTGNLRNILVICSSEKTLQLFRMITRRNLQTPSVHWFVILEENIAKDIASVIKEGTQVSMAVGQSTAYDFFISHVNKNDEIVFTEIGSWKWSPTGSPSRKTSPTFSQPLYRPMREMYRNFGGRVMKSAVIDNTPFFKVNVLPDGTVMPDSGIDSKVLETLGKVLNFTYQLVITEDGQWGGEMANGSFTGMIGKVQSGKAHFAINEITITGPRERVVDFTLPYFMESTAMVSRAPAEKNRAFAVFSPFTAEVWLMLCITTLLMGPLITGATRIRGTYFQYDQSQIHSLSDFEFNIYRSLVIQGNFLFPSGWCQRSLFLMWFFFCFLIYALYAGTLTAVLTIPSFEKPIDSLTDLLVAMDKDDFKANVVRGTSNEFIFSLATGGIYKEIWDRFDFDDGYVYSWDEGVAKVLTGKYVYMNAYLGALIRAKRRGLHNFYFGRNTFYPQSYSIACSNGSPYKVLFDSLLIKMTSAGLVQKWTQDEVDKVRSGDTGGSNGPGAITLVHLQASFFIVVIGYTVAVVALIGEKIKSAHIDSHLRKNSVKVNGYF
ncbi:probable glutamate receptor [Palaemon carinicauda]|uniref:probable glutamate receptor n=1 Tax=Palaemon carinicauda TaxID=392227 RepID=UPI0035B68CEC